MLVRYFAGVRLKTCPATVATVALVFGATGSAPAAAALPAAASAKPSDKSSRPTSERCVELARLCGSG